LFYLVAERFVSENIGFCALMRNGCLVSFCPVQLMKPNHLAQQCVYITRPAIFAPSILSVIAVVAAFQFSWWSLVALPFIWLGSVCAQPNLNLANGCLAYLAMLIGFALTGLFRPLGLAILGGAMSGFYVSSIEKRMRARPAPDDSHS
jgi:hypothetical protein